jgi:biotin-(acetyl-CoA carboxylase) ligase
VTHAVIGIGINVNHNPEDFPEDLVEKAGSLKMFVGQPSAANACVHKRSMNLTVCLSTKARCCATRSRM